MKYKITVEYNPPPIPQRHCDWIATDEDTYEPGLPVGLGATAEEAILDLLEQLKERNNR